MAYHHGRFVLRNMIRRLNRVGIPDPIVVQVDPAELGWPEHTGLIDVLIPDLSNATDVIFAANSGGGVGLKFNADWLASQIAAISPAAKVAVVLDAATYPPPEANAFFGDTATGRLFDHEYQATSPLVDDTFRTGAMLTSTPAAYQPNGYHYERFRTWGDPAGLAFLDASCFASHPVDDYVCYDDDHVFMNHVATDMFIFGNLMDLVAASVLHPEYECTPGATPPLCRGLTVPDEGVLPVLHRRHFPRGHRRRGQLHPGVSRSPELPAVRVLPAPEHGCGRRRTRLRPPTVGLMLMQGGQHTTVNDDAWFFTGEYYLAGDTGAYVYGEVLESWYEGGLDGCWVDSRSLSPLIKTHVPRACNPDTANPAHSGNSYISTHAPP